MDKYDVLGFVATCIILAVCLYIYFDNYGAFDLKCIVSTVDGNEYCVRERSRIQEAADLLARVTDKCKRLVDYVYEKFPDKENVQRLHKGFNPKKVMETLPTSKFSKIRLRIRRACRNWTNTLKSETIDESTALRVFVRR